MDHLEQEILRLAVARGLLHLDEVTKPYSPELLHEVVAQGKISPAHVESGCKSPKDSWKITTHIGWM